jgi:hypothetical protein
MSIRRTMRNAVRFATLAHSARRGLNLVEALCSTRCFFYNDQAHHLATTVLYNRRGFTAKAKGKGENEPTVGEGTSAMRVESMMRGMRVVAWERGRGERYGLTDLRLLALVVVVRRVLVMLLAEEDLLRGVVDGV